MASGTEPILRDAQPPSGQRALHTDDDDGNSDKAANANELVVPPLSPSSWALFVRASCLFAGHPRNATIDLIMTFKYVALTALRIGKANTINEAVDYAGEALRRAAKWDLQNIVAVEEHFDRNHLIQAVGTYSKEFANSFDTFLSGLFKDEAASVAVVSEPASVSSGDPVASQPADVPDAAAAPPLLPPLPRWSLAMVRRMGQLRHITRMSRIPTSHGARSGAKLRLAALDL